MAEALKVKDEAIRGGGSGSGNGSGSTTAANPPLGGFPKRVTDYVHDVRAEMKKANWPSRQDVISTTVVVIVTVSFFGLYFLMTDTIAQKALGWLIEFGKS